MKSKSILSSCITLVGALCIGLSLSLSVLFPEAEEFSQLPLGLKVMLIGGLCLSLLGIVLSFIFKNRTNTHTFSLFIEGGIFLIGVVCAALVLLREETALKEIIVSAAPVPLAVGALCFFSTLIGVCKKGKANRS